MVAKQVDRPRSRRRWIVASAALASPLTLLAAASWWLTAPLDSGTSRSAGRPAGRPAPDVEPARDVLPDWPEGRMEGEPAKRFLLAFMERAVARLEAVDGYSATLTRQERIGGELRPEQRLKIKVQHEPFAVYLRIEAPRAGKEAIYHEGQHDGQVIAHNGDWTRRFLPRVKLDPAGPIAMADNRHPITEAGLAHLSRKLLHFRRLDLGDPHAETVLDRMTDERGRPWFRSLHAHTVYSDDRPFSYVEIRYCPERLIPLHITSYDWPEPGAGGDDEAGRRLAERYSYEDIDLDASLSALDFDPANPEYGFLRY